MAKDFNARAAAATALRDKQRTERHEQLETDIVGLFKDALDSTFPDKDDDTPDWDKFDWNRAEQLRSTLKQFLNPQPAAARPAAAPAASPAPAEPTSTQQTPPAKATARPVRTARPAPAEQASADDEPIQIRTDVPTTPLPAASAVLPSPSTASPQKAPGRVKKVFARLNQ